MDFINRMKEVGIECRVFNPFAPGMRLVLNNRDHRKITVVDNKIGFTGGPTIEIFRPEYYEMDQEANVKKSAEVTKAFVEKYCK